MSEVERKRRREREDDADERRRDSKRGRRDDERERDRRRRRSRSGSRDRSTRRRDDRERREDRRDGERHTNGRSAAAKNGAEPKRELDREAIEEELKRREVFHQAQAAIQQKLKGANPAAFRVANSSIRRDEAEVFVDTMLQKHRLTDTQRKVAATLEALKRKAAGGGGGVVQPAKGADGQLAGAAVPSAIAAIPHGAKKEEPSVEAERPKLDLRPAIPVLPSADPRVQQRGPERGRRAAFKFAEKGTFERQAQKERAQAKLARLQNDISRAAKQTGISSAVRLAIVTPSGAEVVDDLPAIEWWDRVLLGDAENYDALPPATDATHERFRDTISDLIEHPVQFKAPDVALENVPLRVHLTKKEAKRLRRMNRQEIQREQAEKIRLGLERAPEPKVKLSNLMRVLGNDAIQDPTKMEAMVRNQVAERLRKHEEANADRKLTKKQRADKKALKIMEDTSVYVYVAVYKVLSLANPQKRFKVLQNAKQLHMTGVIVGVEDMHVIVVEGGPKQQRFYKNLMLKRIHWSEELVGQKKGVAAEEEEGQRNECVLIWEGTVPTRAFHSEPRIQQAPDHKSARELFAKEGVEHYWDHCFSHSVLLSSND
ncbi:hypothetical protein M3Y99_00515800 [Aphelenchoides fujianensis]|nr:hypothetical protein M3Y99_00515800 [Aphelenchoides fujianensis]